MSLDQDIKKILITNEQIVEQCKIYGERLSTEYNGKTPVFLCLLKGAVPFYAELVKHISIPMEMDFMSLTSYEGVSSTGTVKIKKDMDINPNGRDILIVEDIIDTGLTLTQVVALLKARGAKSVKIITLLDKKEGRLYDISSDYSLFSIPKEFVVGFGLDYNGIYRNLDYIGVLKESVYNK